jgi:LemA protein
MSTGSIVFCVVTLALVVAGIAAYLSQFFNSLVALRHDVDQAWSNIDLLLKQRHDEIRHLVEGDGSDDRLQHVQQRITLLEEQIRHRREYYNQLVTIGNERCEHFPDRLLAAKAGLSPRPLLSATGEERFGLSAARDGRTLRVQAANPFQGSARPAARQASDDRRMPGPRSRS